MTTFTFLRYLARRAFRECNPLKSPRSYLCNHLLPILRLCTAGNSNALVSRYRYKTRERKRACHPGRGCLKGLNNMLKPLLFKAVDKIELSILLTSFSKEELLDYDLTHDRIKTFFKSLLEPRPTTGGKRDFDLPFLFS